MVDIKAGAAIVLTLVVVIFFLGEFSQYLGFDIKNPLRGTEVLSEKRELPMKAEMEGSLANISFSQNDFGITEIVFTTKGDISIGNTKIRPQDVARLSFDNFTGVLTVNNGSIEMKGIGYELSLDNYQFIGANTISFSGKLLEFEGTVKSDIDMPAASGTIEITINNTAREISLDGDPILVRSYLGKMTIDYSQNTLELEGIASRIVVAGVTILR